MSELPPEGYPEGSRRVWCLTIEVEDSPSETKLDMDQLVIINFCIMRFIARP